VLQLIVLDVDAMLSHLYGNAERLRRLVTNWSAGAVPLAADNIAGACLLANVVVGLNHLVS